MEKLRVCIDYRALNKVFINDHFPLPFINNILEKVACHAMYLFVDGYSRYNQIHVMQGDWYKTAFTTPWGTFIYIVMPFGLCNAPATFQRAMMYIFANLLHKSMAVFIDDFYVHGSKESHFEDLRACFECCREYHVSLNPEKTILFVLRGILLWHLVSEESRLPDPEKVKVIAELPSPLNVPKVRSALGHIGWYREVIEDYANTAISLTNLTKKEVPFMWTQECQNTFDIWKCKLKRVPCLISPNWDLPFHIYCDASNFAVGSALCQPFGDEKKDRPIAFASRQLTGAERNYSTTEREALAMVFSIKKYRHYLLLSKVVFYVDHISLRYIVNKPDLSGRIARWVLLLQEFDYEVVYKPGRMHLQADHLSRISEEVSMGEGIDDEFPDAALFAVSSVPIWYNHIAEFLSTQTMPEILSKIERRNVRIESRHFALISGKLYRRGMDRLL